MSDLNLLRYYTRIETLGVGDDIKIGLTTIADALFTSPRHARTLLNQMSALGWLTWEPKVGRGQLSTLILHIKVWDLTKQLASQRIQLGKYEKALAILGNDQTTFGQLLHRTSGATYREGVLHIQLTYKRAFERLVPHNLQRSSERYLIRQIYCCLVSCNEDGTVQPSLAHHWAYDESALEWHFYLRPGLTFHDNTPINAQSVVNLFKQLQHRPEYQLELAHLRDISSTQNLRITFKLSKPDEGFAGLISGVKYSIQPTSQLNQNTSKQVVGCGPFEVEEHSSSKLTLKAFDRYHAHRALTDQVTIWLLDEQPNKDMLIETNHPVVEGTCFHQITTELSERSKESGNEVTQQSVESKSDQPTLQQRMDHDSPTQIEDGCLFVLFNQLKLTQPQRQYLSSLLNTEAIANEIHRNQHQFSSVNAYNLLPHWQPILKPQAERVQLPPKMAIAVYDYTALVRCAYAAKNLLEQQGIEVTINTYSFRQLIEVCSNGTLEECLTITNINLDDNRHSSAFCSLFNNPILHHGLGKASSQWLTEQLDTMREKSPLNEYLVQLEPIASALITQYWLTPLFHHQQTLRFPGLLKDVALTNWGWPDIKNVWSTD